MALTIDQLEIQITTSAGSSATGIDRLASSLEKLGGKLTFTSKLTSFAKSLQKVAAATRGLDTSRISALATSLSAIANVGKINLTSTINQLKKIPEIAAQFNTVDMASFTNKLKDMANALIPLSIQLNSVRSGLSKLPQEIKKVVSASEQGTKATTSFISKLVGLISTWRTLIGAFKTIANTLGNWFKESNNYIETLNLFNITMGEGAEAAMAYAEKVQDLMGIDIAEWMTYQGTFKQLTSGFGVAEESANTMSQNLTQLSYDLASFFNTDVETAFDKLSSAMAGQVKGLREFGIDTTVASLQEYALAKGIDTSVRSMSQAEKSLLRYNYIMENSVKIQGDMARTIITPANALRILNSQLTQAKRALGNIVSVIVTQFIPYVQAMVSILIDAANAIAKFFNFNLEDYTADISGLEAGGFVDDLEDAEDSIGGVSDKLKEIKKQLMGFDELNIISNPDNSSSGGDTAVSAGGGLGDMGLFEYDFLSGLDTSKIDEAKEKLKEIFWIVGEIAAGLLLWKLSKSFLGSLEALAVSAGLVLLFDSVRGVLKDGLDIGDIIKGAIGGALIGAGIGFKLGGFPGAIGGVIIGIGVSLIINGITSIVTEGADVENVATTIGGLLSGALGIMTVIKLFNKNATAPTPEIETATNTLNEVSNGTSKLTGKLTNLIKNLALGLVVLLEVAAAAGIVVGAIWGLGVLLEQVGFAWQPVIDNGNTIITAIGIGTGILLAIGTVTALLGAAGSSLVGYLALGLAMMALLGVSAALFLAEIWAVGYGLNEIYKAWEPINGKGGEIAAAIGIGTGLLIGIGVVTAALGAATVATAGALPLAIGLGTLLLVALAVAFEALIDSLVNVAEQLTDELHPALKNFNRILPTLSTNMENFTGYMKEFAKLFVDYSKDSAISGFASTVNKIIGFFTADPIETMADDVNKQYKQVQGLNDKLRLANPELKTAISLITTYYGFLEKIEELTGMTNNIKLANGMFVSMKEVGVNLITGFVAGMKSETANLAKNVKTVLSDTFTSSLAQSYGKSFGQNIASGLASGFRNASFPTLKGVVDVTSSGSVSLKLRAYAMGGFPEMGEMFIAREAGPELVGSIGNKTAVANNDQIIAGIESGVYRAMVAANGNGGGSQTIRIINEIDGDVVGEKVIRYHNGKVMQTGVSPLLV